MAAAPNECARYLQLLGRVVSDRWSSHNCDSDGFPEIAAAALTELPPEGITPMDLLRWGRRTPDLPPQDSLDKEATELSLCLFWSQRFSIEALFRPPGSTPIHHHGFAGAFRVLEGASVHTRHGFTVDDRVNERMRFGTLSFTASELLRPGDVRPIEPGARHIHALCPFEEKSVTLLVRTHDLDEEPELEYHPPGLATSDEGVDERVRLLEKLLTLLGDHDPAGCHAAVADAVEHADLATVAVALDHASGSDTLAAELDAFAARARVRHGERAMRLARVMAEKQRRRALSSLLFDGQRPEQNLALALLLGAPDAKIAARLFKSRFSRLDLARVIATLPPVDLVPATPAPASLAAAVLQ